MTPEEFAQRSYDSANALCEELLAATESLDSNPIRSHHNNSGVLEIYTSQNDLLKLAHILRDTIGMEFRQLTDITAIDWPERSPRFDVVYHLLSMQENLRVRIIVVTQPDDIIPSVCQLWPCANWYEREVWDMFGIVFSGHPDLRRILTDYGFEGHPLRKDFPLSGHVEIFYDPTLKRIVKKPVDIVQDFRNFDFTMPWNANTVSGMVPSLDKTTTLASKKVDKDT